MVSKNPKRARLTYKDAGVDVAANDRMVKRIRHAVAATCDDRVLNGHNAFAGLFRLDYPGTLLRRNYRDPVLVAGTDGVGSKLLLGLQYGRLGDLGVDLVAMSVNDVLTTGAEPLFFLDYVACNKLVPAQVAEIVEGVARGCRLADCSLLGGETAELPDLYAERHFDLAGFCVGVVERRRLIDGGRVEPGDAVIGLASNGIHSNGYALVRKLLARMGHRKKLSAKLGEPLEDAILRPTRIYVPSILALLGRYRRKRVVRAMAHVTGGGLPGNLPRVIPDDCDVVIQRKSWPLPPIFQGLQRLGVARSEMYRVFNMGIGFVLVVRPTFARSIVRRLNRLGESAYRIGTIRRGSGKLRWA
ncbi:MAG: phosphoribosylformylglycinamidine cyclo-ligase [Planctomycetota bacterium]|nr:phosphoribosylformylglycinamidine cyclo-ligase [Planctomycetota bacterium]